MSTASQNDLNPNAEADLANTLNLNVDDLLAEEGQNMPPEAELAALHGQVADLQTQVKDIQARANADMYNFQKRVERETDNAKKYALEKFAGSLLDVVDNLERAITAAGDQESPLVEGIRLTQKSMLAALEKHGVQVVDPAGQAFNADLHQAVGIAPDVAANQVGVVLQKGYSLNGRLLRPAMVMVGQ